MQRTTTRPLPFLPLAVALAALASGCGDIENADPDAAASVDPDAAASPPDGAPQGASDAGADGGATFPDDALVHLAFEGDLADSSGNGNDADPMLPATFVADRFGFAERAIDMEENLNSDWYNALEVSDLGVRGEVTIAAWIRVQGPGDQRIAGVGNWFTLRFESGDKVGFAMTSETSTLEPAAVEDTANTDDSWVFYAGVVGVTDNLETTVTLYRDGVEVAEATAPEVFEPEACSFWVGDFRDNVQCSGASSDGQRFPGVIDDVRVFDRALSAAEIDLLYRDGGWPETP